MPEPFDAQVPGAEAHRLSAQMRFVLEADRLKQVERRNLLLDASRRENTAEHSWHLALMAGVFAEYAPEGTDIARVTEMLVLHDVVEIDAGDTFIYSEEARRSQPERERTAADRLFGLLPAPQGARARALWEEFDARSTPDARFAKAIDRLSPMLANWHTDGGTWVSHGVTKAQALRNVAIIEEGSAALGGYARRLIEDADRRGYFTSPQQ